MRYIIKVILNLISPLIRHFRFGKNDRILTRDWASKTVFSEEYRKTLAKKRKCTGRSWYGHKKVALD
jgi:hypothetical protein